MNELIKISENNGKKAVSARELYQKLGYDLSQWSRWLKKNITENQFAIENEDFVKLDTKSRTTDFALSIDFAKKISMLARTETGEKIRDYFIEVEKVATKQLSTLDILKLTVQGLEEQAIKLESIDNRIKAIESRPEINAPIEHFSILGYCHNIGKQISLNEAKSYGAKCRKLCNQLGFVIGKISDPRWGAVNTYPESVLKEIIK